MRKLLALILVLSLSVGMFSTHAFAKDSPDLNSADIVPDGEPQGTISSEEKPLKTEKDPVTDNNVTSESTVTDWSDVETVPDGGSDTSLDPIDTKTPEIVGEGETPKGPDEQTITGSTTTTTTGQETDTESWISNPLKGLIGHTKTNEGWEKVEQTKKTVQKDTYYDRLVKDDTVVTEKVNGAVTKVNGEEVGKENPNSGVTDNHFGEWTSDPKTETDNKWKPGSVGDDAWKPNGTPTETTGEPESKNLVGAFDQIDLEEKEEVSISLTPGSTDEQKVTVKKYLDLEEFVNDNTTLDDAYADILENGKIIYAEDGTTEIGRQVSASEYYEYEDYETNPIKKTVTTSVYPRYENGILVGYEVTTTTTNYTDTVKEGAISDPKETYSNVVEGNAYDMNEDLLPEDIKAIYKAGGKMESTDDGVEITVVETVDNNGKKIYVVTKITTENTDGKPENAELTEDDQIAPSGSADGPDYYLPDEPVAVDPYEDPETGNMITTTVNKLFNEDHSRVIGYETVVEEKDENGVVISREVERIYETKVTSETDVVTTVTSKTVETDSTKTTTEVITYSATEGTRDVTITTTKDVEVEKTVNEETVTEIVEIDGQQYEFVFEATMGEVTGKVENTVLNQSTGMLATIPLENFEFTTKASDTNTNNRMSLKNGLTATPDNDLQDDNSKNATWYTPYTKNELQELQKNLKPGEYVLIGYGLHSDYVAYDDNGNINKDIHTGEHSLKQYALLSQDGVSYGYCVELGTGLKIANGAGISGTTKINGTEIDRVTTDVNGDYVYSKQDILTMKNTEIPLKNGDKSLMPLNSIVKNGYTGATSGAGSLDAVKNLLIQYGYTSVANTLTEGEALAATQAAIWKYGNKSTTDADKDGYMDGPTFESLKGFVRQYSEDGQDIETMTAGNQGYDNIYALYTVLTNLAEKATEIGVPTEVSTKTIKGATIVLKEEVAVETYDSVADAVEGAKAEENKIYNTDLSFTLAVSNSDYNGDLVVNVLVGKDVIATRRIAGDASNDDPSILKFAEGEISSSDGSTTYTISDIQLAENVDITIQLTGTQYLTSGVYVYSCDKSQNFIGGQNSVYQKFDLKVDLNFSVTEPKATMTTTSSESTESFTGNRVDTKVDTRQNFKHDVHGNGYKRVEETITTNTKVYATIEVTEAITEETEAEYEWYNFFDPGVSKNEEIKKEETKQQGSNTTYEEFEEEDVPLGNLEIIEDEEVPLTSVPQTGDNSAIWVIMVMISAVGLLMILFSRKHKEA